MAKLNDYSGFNNLFRDGVIGIVVGTGVFSTLLPNVLETLSESRELGTFDALNFFSVIYFVLPVIIVSSYWLLKGTNDYFENSLDAQSIKFIRSSANRPAHFINLTIICSLKVIPILVFMHSRDWAQAIPPALYGIYYAILSIVELAYITLYVHQFLKDKPKLFSLRNRIFRLNLLMFTLDMFIGLALAMFSTPWIYYTPEFYIYVTVCITVYTLAAMSIHWSVNQPKSLPVEIIAVGFLVVTIGCCVPAVNLRWMEYIPWVNFALIFVVILLMTRKFQSLIDYFKIGFPLVVLIITFLILTAGYEKKNRGYFLNRLDAAEQMPNDKLFAFWFYDPFPFMESPPAKNLALKADSFNHLRLKTPAEFHRNQDNTRMLLRKYNTRRIYYTAYDTILAKQFKESLETISQEQLNTFYQGIVTHLQTETFATYFDNCKGEDLMSKVFELREYGHPIDFYAKYLLDEQLQLQAMRELLNELNRMRIIRLLLLTGSDNKFPFLNNGSLIQLHDSLASSIERKQERIQDLREHKIIPERYNSLMELRKSELEGQKKPVAFSRHDSLKLSAMILAGNRFLEVVEKRYEKVYKGGQKIYRSYLVDSQRIGVYTFGAALIIVSMSWFFCYRDEREARGNPGNRVRHDQENKIEPSQLFLIFSLSILILLIPLMRPIRPENIDPEKPYWMMTLQNWYAPTFITKLGDSEKFTPPKAQSGAFDPSKMEDALKTISDKLDTTNKRLKQQSGYDSSKK